MPYDEDGNWVEENDSEDAGPQASSSNIEEYLRRARAQAAIGGETQAPVETPYPGQVPGQGLYQPGPKVTAYKEAVSATPLKQDYHPSVLRRIVSGIGGAAAGVSQGPEAGAAAQRSLADAPYNKKLSEFQQKLGVQGQEAQLEAGGNVAAQKYYLDLAKVQHENAQGSAEVERGKAEAARGRRYDWQTSPQHHVEELENIGARGTKASTVPKEVLWDVVDVTGKHHVATQAPGGAFKNTEGAVIPPDQVDASKTKKLGQSGGAGGEPLLPVQGPNGQVTYTPRSQAVGKPAPKGADEIAATQRNSELQQERNQNHLDKSYQFHTTELDKLSKPIQDYTSRLSRLEDTINQNSVQADALIAPELLSVMAGGQGSGVRMNEAEISRIVGGRTAEDSLKVALSKLSTDPKNAEGISPAQRDQIRSMLKIVRQKINDKGKALSDAGTDILNSKDEMGHRKALDTVKKKLDKIDIGNPEGATDKDMVPAQIPGQPPGIIHRAQIANFKKKYPNAVVGQ